MGLDAQGLKTQAGLDEFDLDNNELRLSCDYATRCYQIAELNWQGEHFGLEHGTKYQPFTLGIVGHLLTTANTALAALQSYERYQEAFGDGLRFVLTYPSLGLQPDPQLSVNLWVHPKLKAKVNSNLVDSFFVGMVQAVRSFTTASAPLLGVDLQRAAPANSEKYSEIFGCPVRFSQDDNRLTLSMKNLEQPLFTANPALYQMLEQQVKARLKRRLDLDDFANQVRYQILSCIDGNKIELERIAKTLSMSGRTLSRKLKKSGHNFQRLLDDVRIEFSQQQLQLNEINIEELAYLLGFSEPGIFRKTFKRWTG